MECGYEGDNWKAVSSAALLYFSEIQNVFANYALLKFHKTFARGRGDEKDNEVIGKLFLPQRCYIFRKIFATPTLPVFLLLQS